MSLTDLIFGAPVLTALGTSEPGVGIIEFDCTESIMHTGSNEITDHPIEDGSVLSDHIRQLPDGLNIHALVSDTPIVYLASVFAKSPVKANANASVKAVDDRKAEAYAKLLELKAKGILITAVTALRTYYNVTIQELGISQDASTGKVLDCTVTLREVQKASSLVLTSPTPEDVANKAAEKQAKVSKAAAKEKQSAQSQSTLSELAGLFGG